MRNNASAIQDEITIKGIYFPINIFLFIGIVKMFKVSLFIIFYYLNLNSYFHFSTNKIFYKKRFNDGELYSSSFSLDSRYIIII